MEGHTTCPKDVDRHFICEGISTDNIIQDLNKNRTDLNSHQNGFSVFVVFDFCLVLLDRF